MTFTRLQSTKNLKMFTLDREWEFIVVNPCCFGTYMAVFLFPSSDSQQVEDAVGQQWAFCSSTLPAACDAPHVQSVSCDVRLWELEKRCGNNWCGSACVLGTHGDGFCIDAAALCMRTSPAGCASQNLPIASTFVLMSSATVIFLPWPWSGILLAVVYSACVWFNWFSWFAPCFLISSVFPPCWLASDEHRRDLCLQLSLRFISGCTRGKNILRKE